MTHPATAHQPIDDQLVTYTERLIFGTGQDSNAYKSWLALHVASRTYQNLKVHFTAKYQLLNKMH
eukprot:6968583-Ditylum_brightwellii.AAC.1